VIIESNSILEHITPLLYLVVLDSTQSDFKESARRALDRADGLIFVTPAAEVPEGSAWPDVDFKLSPKPRFQVSKPSFWAPPLGEFVSRRLSDSPSSVAHGSSHPHRMPHLIL